VCRELGETMTDEEITEMMHNTHILNLTETNYEFTFEEFYAIIMKKKY
jgi:Ca2+-binding EF-hand superfamily protein